MGVLFVRARLAEGHLIALFFLKSKGRKFDDIDLAGNLLSCMHQSARCGLLFARRRPKLPRYAASTYGPSDIIWGLF